MNCSMAIQAQAAAGVAIKAWHRLTGLSFTTSLLSLVQHPWVFSTNRHITQNLSGEKLVPIDPNADPIGGSPSPSRPRRCSAAKSQLQGEALPGALPQATSFDRLNERCRQLFGVDMKRCTAGERQMFNRCRAETLLRNLDTAHKQLGPQLTTAIAVKYPSVFRCSSNTLGARIQGVKTLMCAGDDVAFTTLVLKHPDVLKHDPTTMARKGQQLSDILDLSMADAIKLFVKSPILLGSDSCALRQNVLALSTRLGMSKLQCQQMIKRFPRVIMYSADLIHAKFVALQELVGDKSARRLVVTLPQLLGFNREQFAPKLHVLYKLFGLDDALLMLQEKPALLGYASEAVTAKWQSMEQLANLSTHWTAQLQTTLSSASIARLLTSSPERHVRLVAILELGCCDVWSLSTTLTIPELEFERKLEATAGHEWFTRVWRGRLAGVAQDVGVAAAQQRTDWLQLINDSLEASGIR